MTTPERFVAVSCRVENIHGTDFLFVAGHCRWPEEARFLRDHLTAILPPQQPVNWQDHCKTHTELHDELDRLRAELERKELELADTVPRSRYERL